MKLSRILLVVTLSAIFALPSFAYAGRGKTSKGSRKGQRPVQVVRSYDKNSDGQIEGDEVEALKKGFADDPKGPLAVLDKNNNATLEDDEISAVNARLSKRADRAAKKGKKKQAL